MPDEADWENIKNKPEKVEPIKLPTDCTSKSDDFDKFEPQTLPTEGRQTVTGNEQPCKQRKSNETSLTQSTRLATHHSIYSLVVGSFAEKANAQNS